MEDVASEKAVELLLQLGRPQGMMAASEGYAPALWTRDIMITHLGAALVNDDCFQTSFRVSLETLARSQSPLGQIPNAYFSPTVCARNSRDTLLKRGCSLSRG